MRLNAEEQIILDLILALKDNEAAAGKFYAACAAEYVKHRAHWLFLQAQEEEHALVIAAVENDFRARPHRWKRGRVMPDTVRYITNEVQQKTALVAGKRMSAAHAVNFSIDFESSLVEKELLSAVSTSDPEFEIRLVKLRTETEDHRQRLQALNREVRT